uniref:hypothetical protein n=1 Tax=Enterocloster clostridioformis TaxID=1531 RepID=UPI0025A561BB|nr:hypothetical protein [Enterocloster clostridioformis]
MTVTTEDGQHKDTCEADITFTTTALTIVHPEKVQFDKEELVFEIELVGGGVQSDTDLEYYASAAVERGRSAGSSA